MPKTSGNFFEAGVRFVVRNAREAIRSTNTFSSAQKQLMESMEGNVIAATKQSKAYKQAASLTQQFAAETIKANTSIENTVIRTSMRAGAITRQQAADMIAANKIASRYTQEAVMAADAVGSLASAEQVAVIAERVSTEAKRQLAISTALVAATISATTNTLNMYLIKLVQVVSQEQALQRSTYIIAASRGISAEAVTAETEAIRKQLFTRTQAATGINKMITAEMDLGDATRFATIANDISVATGKEANEVYIALTDAVRNASAETLRSAGIGANATMIYEDYAASIKKTASALTDEDKRAALRTYIIRAGTVYQGAFASAMGTTWVQTRRANQELLTLRDTLGKTLTPVITEGARILTFFYERINAIPKPVQETAIAVIAATSATVGIGSAVALLIPLVKALAVVLGPVAGAIGMANPWVLVVGVIVALIGTIAIAVAKARQSAKDMAEDFSQSVAQKATQMAEAAEKQFDAAISAQVRSSELLIAKYEASLRSLEKISYAIQRAQEEITDKFFVMKLSELALDKPLWNIEDKLTRISAAATLVLVPLNRRSRMLTREIEDLREIVDQEKERAKDVEDSLKEQLELQRALLAVEQDRLEAIQHDITMEELRNKIFRRAGSGRLLELKSEAALQSDILARKQKEIDNLQEQYDREKEVANIQKTAAEMQLDAAIKRQAMLDREIALEEEKRTYQEEELALAKARQVEDRLHLAQWSRQLDEQQMWRQRDLELLQRQTAEIQRQTEIQRIMISDLEDVRKNRLGAFYIENFPGLKAQLEEINRLTQISADIGAAKIQIEKELETSRLVEKGRREKEKKLIEEKIDLEIKAAQAIRTEAWKTANYLEKIKLAYEASWERTFKGKVWVDILKLVSGTALTALIRLIGLEDVANSHPWTADMAPGGPLFDPERDLTSPAAPWLRDLLKGKDALNAQSSTGTFIQGMTASIKSFEGGQQKPTQMIQNTTNQAPTLSITANYAKAQTVASVTDDMRMLLKLL